ncbi:hypothetical protein LOTGIDRAFT_160348 [Lottia gigantea]|uniref:Protein kinase domain-containing protein n=1 Tax=Lottia gigantea TaxID=225164 RepID=V4AQ60_LOTGI|nr:hypothetical protein LOTGIDRAFT_160348 [Lottia gigantea]ESO95801.1 hypothetical protein LOTGIDRAFT_160348 [Lottia gigantea]
MSKIKIRPNTVDDVNNLTDLISATRALKELGLSAANIKTLEDAKARIIQGFSKEKAQEIYKKNDCDPMQKALKENEKNRHTLTDMFKKAEGFLKTLSSNFQEDLNRVFPEFNKSFCIRSRDLEKSSCYILVAGESGAGKSTIINLLLGTRLLPTSDLYCTSNICELRQSDKRCYMLYHKDRRKPPEIFDYDESRSLDQYMEIMANHIRLSNQESGDTFYEKIEIYWPFPYNMEKIVFVDTPGVSDDLSLSASLQKYMNKSFGFIYVLNSAAAGGIHKDRLGRLLRLAQERGDEDFDPSAALFVCNKHDLLKDNEVAGVMDVSLEKLQGCYPGVVKEQLYPISAMEATKTAEYGRGILKEHTKLIDAVRNVLPKIFHSQLAAHYRWLVSVIKRTLYTLKMSLVLDTKSIEDKRSIMTDVKNQMSNLAQRADDRIKLMKTNMDDSVQRVVNDVLKIIDQNQAELSMWGPNTYPQPDKDWKVVARKASLIISDRIANLIDEWDSRRNVVGQIKQGVLDKFKNDCELFEDQIKQIEGNIGLTVIYINCIKTFTAIAEKGTFLGVETKAIADFHHSIKYRSNVKAIWKTNKKEKYGGSIGIAVAEATSLNIKSPEVRKVFKDYSRSSKAGELMRQATYLFIQDLTPSLVSEALKKYFTRFTKEIDEISRLIPIFLETDKEMIKTLTADVHQTEQKLSEFYPQLIHNCTHLCSELDYFYCRKLMKADFPFDSFVIENNRKQIGEGTFATVFKSTIPGTNKPVALKVCKEPLTEANVSEVLSEHAASRGLRHRNIILYYGSSRIIASTQLKFVMVLEYCVRNLQELIRAESYSVPSKCDKQTSMQKAMLDMADQVKQIASGLGYLHQKSIIHRDLKTENILVTSDRVLKLSDLGLAKIGLASTKQVGSPVYMAPEVLLGSSYQYGKEIDIYGLAVVMWEMWYGQDVADHIQMMLTGKFEECVSRGLRPSLTLKCKPPSEWSAVISKCWSQVPARRLTCAELIDFFHKFLERNGN